MIFDSLETLTTFLAFWPTVPWARASNDSSENAHKESSKFRCQNKSGQADVAGAAKKKKVGERGKGATRTMQMTAQKPGGGGCLLGVWLVKESWAEGSLCVPCGNFLSACGTNTKATACHAASQAGSFDRSVKCKCPSLGAACSCHILPHTHSHTHAELAHSHTRFQLAHRWLIGSSTSTQIVCHLMAAALCAYIKALPQPL